MAMRIESLAEELAKPEDARLREVLDALDGRARHGRRADAVAPGGGFVMHDHAILLHGDALEQLRELPDDSIDALVTDPPAGISFMGKGWDSDKGGRDEWIAWLAEIMREALRVLKPGAHALVWALPRTSHWTATAIEDAGFEIRDVVAHLFGTGFPKSLDVSKAIDKDAGIWRGRCGAVTIASQPSKGREYERTDDARRWQGFGTALKPAREDWILARKPLDGTVAANVLAHGTGALNIDGCRIGESKRVPGSPKRAPASTHTVSLPGYDGGTGHDPNVGRWPANLTLDEEAARALDEQSGTLTSGARKPGTRKPGTYVGMGYEGADAREYPAIDGDAGGASRFFYVAKPSTAERDRGLEGLPVRTAGELTDREEGSVDLNSPRSGARAPRRNVHPTVKPIALMRWLVRLITPPGGIVLDCFAGSGTTGIAAIEEGFGFVGIERDADYFEILSRRVASAKAARERR